MNKTKSTAQINLQSDTGEKTEHLVTDGIGSPDDEDNSKRLDSANVLVSITFKLFSFILEFVLIGFVKPGNVVSEMY